MKHLKKFESNIKIFKDGDYVIGKDLDIKDKDLNYFLTNNVGEIVDDVRNRFNKTMFIDVPPELNGTGISMTDDGGGTFLFFDKEIRHATENEIEIYKFQKHTKKYNI